MEKPSLVFLLPELLTPIIHFLETDYSSLHTCVLVNRSWCRIASPLLWRYPFSDRLNNEQYRLIPVYLGCLDPGTKEWVNELTHNFPPHALKSPMFHYVKYLRSFDYYSLFHAVRKWCEGQRFGAFVLSEGGVVPDIQLNPSDILLKLLIDLFLDQAQDLQGIGISAVSHRNGEFLQLEEHEEELTRPRLSKLIYLECDDCIPENLMFASEVCTNLVQLNIECSWGNDEEIMKLFKVQKKLKRLIVSKRWPLVDEAFTCEEFTDSLISVTLINNMNLVDNGGNLSVLSACKNLESIRFEDWMTFREGDLMVLLSTPFPNLRRVIINHSKPPPQVLISMLTMNGVNLQELKLDWSIRTRRNNNNNQQLPQVINAVAEHCPNVRYFEAPIQRKEIPELYSLLRNCKRLESLILNESDVEPKDSTYDVDHFLPVMGIIIPQTLYQLKIFASWKFTAETLRQFLMETCTANLTRMGFKSIGDEHLEVITSYSKEKNPLNILDLVWCNIESQAEKAAKEYIECVKIIGSSRGGAD
ncbi:874_t:CDS:1 [Diversispora eburnea]|uniref:874_t:CDS:1 n=1 Tax=Diversispora eburnea TaxID=1213867 RepID=A0A9N9B1R1_9GLOM|nr:874_t:CDS:1 [Diversispora eburnea]